MLPASGGTLPNSPFTRVLLPDPFSPSSPKIVPAARVKSIRSLARTLPYEGAMPRLSSSGAMTRHRRWSGQSTPDREGAMKRRKAARAVVPGRSFSCACVLPGRFDLHGAAGKLLLHLVQFLHHRGRDDRVELLALGIGELGAGHWCGVVAVELEGAKQLARFHLLGGRSKHGRPILEDVGQHALRRHLRLVETATGDIGTFF